MSLNICNFDPLDTSTPLSSNAGFNPLDPTNCTNNTSITDSLLNCNGKNPNSLNLEDSANEVVDLFGMYILYYRQEVDIKKVHPVYGESCAPFSEKPYLMKAYVNVLSDTSFLGFSGIQNENDVELQIGFDEWNKAVGANIAPNAGDLFEIKDLLCNRPSGFTRAIFKVTTQGDADLFESTKRWTIVAKRNDHTFLRNEPKEEIDDQVTNSPIHGEIDTITHEPIEGNSEVNECNDIDEIAQQQYTSRKTSVYGGYYD